MQLELSAEIEEALNSEAQQLGLSAAELSTKVLEHHARHWKLQPDEKSLRSGWTIDDYIAFMISRNPNYATTDPYSVDWQAVKAEGRPY